MILLSYKTQVKICTMQNAQLNPMPFKAKSQPVFIWLVVCGLLLGSVLGIWKSAGLGNAKDPLRMQGLTQLILQDICISHGSQTTPDQTSDSSNSAPAHKHCAACLIAMDPTLPENGGTWRAQSEPLSHARAPAQSEQACAHRLPKPHSHAPPLYV